MVLNRKVTGKAMSIPGGIGVGTGAAVLTTTIGSALVAWLTDGERMPESAIGYGAMVTLLCASMVGAWTSASVVKRQRLMVCLVTGGVFLLLLLGLTAFCFGGQYQGVVPTALLVAGGSIAAALIGNLGQGNRTPQRHNRKYG